MATSFDMGLLGDLFGGGGETGLEGYLTPAQQAAMQRQGLLQAAMAIGQASGPSTTPRSLMQILSSGVAAGQQGYAEAQKNAITNLLTRQKLDEAKRQLAQQEAYQRFIMGQPTEGMEITPQQAISAAGMPVGPTVQRAEMIGQPAPRVSSTGAANLSPQMRQLLAALPAKEGIPEALKFMQPAEITGDIFTAENGTQYQRTKTGQFLPIPAGMKFAQETVGEPFKAADGNFYLRTKTGGFVPVEQGLAAKPVGQPQQMMGPNGKPALVQMYDDGTSKVVSGFTPLIPPEKIDTGGGVRFVNPYEIPSGTVFPKTLPPQVVGSAEGGYFAIGGGGGRGGMPTAPPAPSEAPVVAPSRRGPPMPGAAVPAPAATGPQPIIPGTGKAFANEKDLRTEFSAQVKPYTELAQAFRKVEAAALNPSAAGDISLVYGYMKILDPGSTVMQGEQATAQNAGSVPDSVRAMYNKALTGESLAPTIRQDFYAQARNIIESQRELSNDLIQRYTGVAREYKLNPNQIVYDPFKRIKTPTEVAAEALKNQGKPKTNTTYTNQYGLTPRSK